MATNPAVVQKDAIEAFTTVNPQAVPGVMQMLLNHNKKTGPTYDCGQSEEFKKQYNCTPGYMGSKCQCDMYRFNKL